MLLQIHASSGLAIYDQIVRQVKFAIAHRALRSGERVPSVRDLAKQLAVNPNTVARAYRQLQDERVLEPVRGLGLQVTLHAESVCQVERRALVRERLRGALVEAVQAGLAEPEILELVRVELADIEPSSAESASVAGAGQRPDS